MPNTKEQATAISENSWITLSSAYVVIGAVIIGVLNWATMKSDGAMNSQRIDQTNSRLDQGERRVDGIEGKVDVVNERTARMEEMMKFLVQREKQK